MSAFFALFMGSRPENRFPSETSLMPVSRPGEFFLHANEDLFPRGFRERGFHAAGERVQSNLSLFRLIVSGSFGFPSSCGRGHENEIHTIQKWTA